MSSERAAPRYRLHVKVAERDASPAQTGKALGALFRRHLKPNMIGCTAELVTANKVACRAHAVIRQLLGCASFWEANAASRYPVREVLLDDDAIRSLEKQWAATRTREFLLIIPHMFYLPLLRLSICNLKQHAPALMERTCLYIDYSRQLSSFDLVRRAYLGERTKVLRYLTREGMPCVDTGRQLFMENVISLAAYMSPAQCLVFKDDDFLLAGGEPVAKVVTTLREGALLSGMYTAKFDRLHTCFFGMRSEALRDHLALFDNGENTYASTSMDTGSITYQSLREVPGAVRSLGDYAQSESGEVRCGGELWGRHLRHCASELWIDFPGVLAAHFDPEQLASRVGRCELNADILLEAVALFLGLDQPGGDWMPYSKSARDAAAEYNNLPAYFSTLHNNHHWLMQEATRC